MSASTLSGIIIATFRYYEVAGGAHLSTHNSIELIPVGILGPDPLLLEDLIQNELNSTTELLGSRS